MDMGVDAEAPTGSATIADQYTARSRNQCFASRDAGFGLGKILIGLEIGEFVVIQQLPHIRLPCIHPPQFLLLRQRQQTLYKPHLIFAVNEMTRYSTDALCE